MSVDMISLRAHAFPVAVHPATGLGGPDSLAHSRAHRGFFMRTCLRLLMATGHGEGFGPTGPRDRSANPVFRSSPFLAGGWRLTNRYLWRPSWLKAPLRPQRASSTSSKSNTLPSKSSTASAAFTAHLFVCGRSHPTTNDWNWSAKTSPPCSTRWLRWPAKSWHVAMRCIPMSAVC